MKKEVRVMLLVLVVSVAVIGWPLLTPNVGADDNDNNNNGGRPRADFALLNMEPVPLPPSTGPDVSVQCGAIQGSSSNPRRTAFTMFITMGNRGDSGLGGVDGGVRVTYQDGDFVDYPIKAGETLQMSLAGGGTPGVDQAIKVSSSPGPLAGAVLIGQVSLITDRGKPNPVIDPTGISFCNTTPAGSPSPF